MPKMFVQVPHGLFDRQARGRVAAALTELGMRCEQLSDTPAVKGGV